MDCEATSKQVEKLAKHFTGEKNLKFARIDASLNEHSKLQVRENFKFIFNVNLFCLFFLSENVRKL